MGQHKNLDEANNHRMKRILFVDDDADTTAIMKVGLNRRGFEVDTFVDSKLALQNFKAGVYDLLLLDVLMKGIDGFELYDKMRKIDENIQNSCWKSWRTLYRILLTMLTCRG
jgi:CheY-like chemotaxis protein